MLGFLSPPIDESSGLPDEGDDGIASKEQWQDEIVPETTLYSLRSPQLQLRVRQLPSKGLSFQLWPAASALCWFLEELFGERGMYKAEVSRLDQYCSVFPHTADRSESACSSNIEDGTSRIESFQDGETQAQSSSCQDLDSRIMVSPAGLDEDAVAKDEKKMRVLELGAGTGMVGILSAVLGADAIITDLPHVIPNLLYNASLNEDAVTSSGRGGRINVKTLRWGDEADMQAIGRSFDLILASDVIYYDHLFEPLLRTLQWLLSEGKKGNEQSFQLPDEPHESVCEEVQSPFVLLAHVRRWKKDAHFFRKASKLFHVKVVHNSPLENCRTGVTVYCFSPKKSS